MNKWENNLLNRAKLWKGQVIPVSAISSFIFCRKDPELFLRDLQKPESLAMINGTTSHEEILKEFVPIKVRETIRAIKKIGPVRLREFSLIMKHNGYLIAGRLDEIIFGRGRPIVLLDDKFPKSLRNFECARYPDQEAQLLLYAFLLQKTGFDIRDLKMFLVKHYQDQDREFEIKYDRTKVEDILTSCETVQKLYYSSLSETTFSEMC